MRTRGGKGGPSLDDRTAPGREGCLLDRGLRLPRGPSLPLPRLLLVFLLVVLLLVLVPPALLVRRRRGISGSFPATNRDVFVWVFG